MYWYYETHFTVTRNLVTINITRSRHTSTKNLFWPRTYGTNTDCPHLNIRLGIFWRSPLYKNQRALPTISLKQHKMHHEMQGGIDNWWCSRFPFVVRNLGEHCLPFCSSYIVLIKTLWLSPLAGVSGVEGVWSLHVVMRQPGRQNILNAASWSSFFYVRVICCIIKECNRLLPCADTCSHTLLFILQSYPQSEQ